MAFLSLRCCQVDLHFRTLDFGQVTVGSSNVRNLAVTNNLPQAILAELVGLEGQSELAGTGPPAQVVPAGATAGFDVHFKCHTEQVTLETRVGTAGAKIKRIPFGIERHADTAPTRHPKTPPPAWFCCCLVFVFLYNRLMTFQGIPEGVEVVHQQRCDAPV